MSGEERRSEILTRLNQSTAPISATRLANEFSVTRQIIVADIALLRAAGHSIRAEHRGYVLESKTSSGDAVKRFVVKHGKEDVRKEFYAIVDHGGTVLDVIVEHSVYGRISVELNIASRYDADAFVRRINETGANPLSLLTEGLHIHTVSAKDEASFARMIEQLTELNIFIEST